MDFEEESGTRAFLLRARREGLRDFGACMAPMTAFQILQGVETLHLRMPRHVENTRKVVEFLVRACRRSKRSSIPSCPTIPTTSCAKKLLPNGCGAVFSFEIKGGRPAGKRFIESLRVFSHLANVGDAKSLVIHPATTTHYRMSDADLKKAGITAGTVRLSIGLEDAQDLIDDLDRALKAARRDESRGRRARRRSPTPPRTRSTRAKPTVVFVHGAGLDHSWFGLQSRYFGYHGRNVLALDLPGHGRSRGPAARRRSRRWPIGCSSVLDAHEDREGEHRRPFDGLAGRARVRRAPAGARRAHRAASASPTR